jgi:hypothetical protein
MSSAPPASAPAKRLAPTKSFKSASMQAQRWVAQELDLFCSCAPLHHTAEARAALLASLDAFYAGSMTLCHCVFHNQVRKTQGRGFGLFALEDMEKDRFVIEYMGEVVNKKQYEKRRHQYEVEHNTYFMSLRTEPNFGEEPLRCKVLGFRVEG